MNILKNLLEYIISPLDIVFLHIHFQSRLILLHWYLFKIKLKKLMLTFFFCHEENKSKMEKCFLVTINKIPINTISVTYSSFSVLIGQ